MARLSHNIIALAVVQAGNFLVPLLALPYFAHVLGAESYGHVVWVQTIMLFGVIWVDFGFGWSATREISANRSNKKYVARLFANNWAIQWCLALAFSLVVVVFAFAVGGSASVDLYLVGLGIVFGQVLLPMWLFQGLEMLKEVALIQLLGKSFALPLIFLCVKESQDELSALLFFSISAILSGLMSLIWIGYRKLIYWVYPDAVGMYIALRNGALLFSSRLLISLYTIATPLAVGYWAGVTQLAYFNLADKLRLMIQALLAPVSQALFPRMSWLFTHDKIVAYALLRKIAIGFVTVTVLAGIALWLAAQQLMLQLGGEGFVEGAAVLRWLAFVPVFVALSNLMGVQIMLPQAMNKQFTVVLMIASIISVLSIYPMISLSGAVGAAQLVLAVECLVTVLMGFYLFVYFRLKRRD